MRIAPRDIEKLWLHTACMVAQKRYARGLKLNYPESIALLSGQILELIRDGHTIAEINKLALNILGTDDVMPGVAEMIEEVQVEGTFVDGTKLISIHHPICKENLSPELALYGSGFSKKAPLKKTDNSMCVVPGYCDIPDGEIEINKYRKTKLVEVTNTGSRPVQVGSHCNFVETNKALSFDREATVGYRLNIPAGTAIRWEPKQTKAVELVEIGGDKIVFGGNNIVNGSLEGRSEYIAENISNFISDNN